jgi:hypothetical protein
MSNAAERLPPTPSRRWYQNIFRTWVGERRDKLSEMAIIGTVIGVLAFIATAWGVYYARGQLREAQEIRMQNQLFIENQTREDDLWSEKSVRASELLCKVAPRFVQGGPGIPTERRCTLPAFPGLQRTQSCP